MFERVRGSLVDLFKRVWCEKIELRIKKKIQLLFLFIWELIKKD